MRVLQATEIEDVVCQIGVNVAPFFGTLLGLVRQGSSIEGDNDLDFCIPEESLREATFNLRENGWLEIRSIADSNGQVWLRTFQAPYGSDIVVDLYVFSKSEDKLVFRQHWLVENIEDPSEYLLVPSKQVEWLFEVSIKNVTLLGADPKVDALLCFLYSDCWRSPARKWIDYVVQVRDGIPEYHFVRPWLKIWRRAAFVVEGWLSGNPTMSFTFKRLISFAQRMGFPRY